MPPVADCEAFGLLRGGSPEEAWAGALVPNEQAFVYRLRGHADDPYPATGDVLQDSNIGELLKRRKISALLLSSPFTPQVREWSRRFGIRILAAPYEQQRRLENKLSFDRLLARHTIPRPDSTVVVAGEAATRAVAGPVVVQRADSLGGEGTFYLESAAEWPALAQRLQLPRGERCLLRRFVKGRPLGITLFVAPGVVRLSAVRLQCYYPPAPGDARRLFAGIQWLRTREFSRPLKANISAVFQRLGTLLHKRRYFGFANFDFLIDPADCVWVIECNPRMSAATPQLLANPALSGGAPLGRSFLEGCRQAKKWPQRVECSPLPDTDFAGATLDATSLATASQPVRREHASGLRRSARAPSACSHSPPRASRQRRKQRWPQSSRTFRSMVRGRPERGRPATRERIPLHLTHGIRREFRAQAAAHRANPEHAARGPAGRLYARRGPDS